MNTVPWSAAVRGFLAAGLLLAAAWQIDRHARSGMDIEYRVRGDDGSSQTLARAVLPSSGFPSELRALADYIHHWPAGDHPENRPPIDIVLGARLHVPDGLPHKLRVLTPNEASTTIDGRPLEEGPLSAGPHELSIHWTGAFQAPYRAHRSNESGLHLRWEAEDGSQQPVELTSLSPISTSWPPPRVALWLGTGAVAIVMWLLVFAAYRTSVASVRRRRVARVLSFAILVLGVGLRLHEYEVSPPVREIPAEMVAAANGWQLVEDGSTWGSTLGSTLGSDPDSARTLELQRWWGQPFVTGGPAISRSAGHDLLLGIALHAAGVQAATDARPIVYRTMPIVMNAITLLLVMMVGRKLYPRGPTPWLAGLLYAALPLICLQARFAVGASLVAMLMMVAIACFLVWRDGGLRLRWLVAASIAAGLAVFGDLVGLALVLALVAVVARHNKRAAIAAATLGALTASSLSIYGAMVDWDLFIHTLTEALGTHAAHWNLFPRYLSEAVIGANHTGRGWLLFLWLSFALGIDGDKPNVRACLIVIPLVYLAAVAMTAGPDDDMSRMFPIYGALCLGAGNCLARLWHAPDLLRALPLIALGVMYGLNFLLPLSAVGYPDYVVAFKHALALFLAAAFAPFVAHLVFHNYITRSLARTAVAAGIAATLALSAYVVVNYDRLYREYPSVDYDRAIN